MLGTEEMDGDLEQVLASVRDIPRELPTDELDVMFQDVQGRVRRADARPGWWWKTRATSTRRAIALGSFVLIAVCTASFAGRSDLEAYPVWRMALEVGVLGVLLVASLLIVIRPTHVPALPRWTSWSAVGSALAATFVLAALPPPHAAATLAPDVALHQHGMPCVYLGLLLGIPVYAVVRLLDRGNPLSALVAAGAAGIAGNVLLQMHCPVNEPAHNLLGHFGVAAIFVVAVALFELFRARTTRRN